MRRKNRCRAYPEQCKNRIIVAGLCMLLLCLLLIGCASEQEEHAKDLIRASAPDYDSQLITIGMIQTGKESDWRDANTNSYLNTFTKGRGYNLIYIDANSSPERQYKAMADLIQQEVDYIILQPIVEEGWEELLDRAKAAEIPVVIADRQVSADEQSYASWVGSDFYEEGKKAVLWLEEYLQKQGRSDEQLDIVLIEGTKGATAANGRTQGILDGVKRHKNWRIAATVCGNFTQGEAQTVMEELLSKQLSGDDIDVVIAENDNMSFGAMKALERNGFSYGPDGRIIMVSFDALGEAFQRMIDGQLHISVECKPQLAGLVEQVIHRIEAGGVPEKKYYTNEEVYTYENAAKFIGSRTY